MSRIVPILPHLTWHPTAASGNRHGHPVNIIVVHRWGMRYTTQQAEGHTYDGVVNYLANPRNGASAHIVYPGSAAPNEATQMVSWEHYAWAEEAYNPDADEVESADAIWLGKDPAGMEGLARIVACRLHARELPPVWSTRRGFCRHADLGIVGGGHPFCPTTDMKVWRHFCSLVQKQHSRGGCRPWGR